MPRPDLTPEEYAEIVRLVRSAIDGDGYPLSPQVKRLKSNLAKLDPQAERPTAIPYPPPLPSAEPSFLYRRIREFRDRGAFLIAMDLKERVEDIDREKPVPTPTEEQVEAILRRRQRRAGG